MTASRFPHLTRAPLAALLFSLAAPLAAQDTLLIGSVAPLTESQSHIGKDNDNGARMAAEEINAAGGIKLGGKTYRIEVVSEDDRADPKTGSIVAQRLVDKKVKAVVGHLNSGTTIPASRIYHENGIVQVSPSATAVKYTAQGYPGAFRLMANDAQQGAALGAFAAKQFPKGRFAVVDDRTQYGQGLADEFIKAAKAAGGTLLTRQYTTDKATDFLAILTAIKAEKPDLVFFGGMDPQGAPMARQMKQLGINAPLLGGDGLQTANFIKLAGADAEGTLASSPGVPLDKMPGGADFKSRYEKKYGPIQLYAPYAYDAMKVLAAAIERAGSTEHAKLAAAMRASDHAGVTGRVRYDAKGDITGGAVTLYQVNNGAWQVLETVGGN